MNKQVETIIARCTTNPPAPENAIRELEQARKSCLPDSYLELLARHNGLEGFVCETAYLILWPAEQLIELNASYGFSEYAPHLFLFGSNGGDAGYAFDTRSESLSVVEVPFIDLRPVGVVGRDFVDFLIHLSGLDYRTSGNTPKSKPP
jgi:hypothetical protein